MKLAIVYHVYKNSNSLKASLESLFGQSDRNFELFLINDEASASITKIIKEFDFSKLKKFTYVKYSQNLGHAISFNQAINSTTADYVMFVGSNFIPQKNFVKVVNNIIKDNPKTDVISFNNVKNDISWQVFDMVNNKMKLMLDHSMKDKLFSVNLLHQHQIFLNENFYSPLLFIYQILVHFTKWIIVDFNHAEYTKNKNYTYNFYDIFEQNDEMIRLHSKTKFWSANLDLIEYFMIVYILHTFLMRIFNVYPQRQVQQSAIQRAENWLTTNIPKWRNNKILNNRNSRNPELFKLFIKIKFKTKYISKLVRKYKL